jgi:AraC-like DNA-binding protein
MASRAPVSSPQPEAAPDVTMLASWTLGLVESAIADPTERAAFLRRFGVDVGIVAASPRDARIPHDAAIAIWAALTDASDDPIFGLHFAEQVSHTAFGIVGLLAKASENALHALRRVIAYHRLVKGDGHFAITQRADEVSVVDMPSPGSARWPRHLAEAILFTYGACIERWSGRAPRVLRVRVQHPLSAVAARALRTALGVAVEAGADENEIVFDVRDLEVPFTTADDLLIDYLVPVADALLAALPDDDALLRAVESAVRADLPSGDLRLERIAKRLSIGDRTLQRRLRDRNMTFKDVVERVRRATAPRLLANPRLSATEVAFLLGYEDVSSFRRAHKRWTGKSPGETRGTR